MTFHHLFPILVMISAVTFTHAHANETNVVSAGEEVRLITAKGAVTGEYLRTERGQWVLRDPDEAIVRVTATDVRTLEVSRSVDRPGRALKMGLTFGLTTLAVGGIASMFASDEGFILSDRAALQLITLAATPVMTVAGLVIGSTWNDTEWVEIPVHESRTARRTALHAELMAERAARAPARPVGASLSASF